MPKARAKMSREVRAARAEIQKGVDRVARSVAEIQVALRRAKRKIEADAGGSWRDVKNAADRTLTDARTVAESVIERFRRAVRE